MAEAEDLSNAPKFHKDRSAYGEALQTWFARQHPEATGVSVSGIDIPAATGFSNETIFFDVDWAEGGEARSERFVGRIEPPTGALFPAQTAESAVSVGVQHRAMATVAEHGVPMCPLVGYEPDAAVLGQPFFVMGFVPGVVPADVPRYSQEGFLVDEATPEERTRMVRTGLEAMASIHAIDWREAGLDWLDASGTGNPTQAVQLRLYRDFVMEQLAGREHPVLFAALDWLDANDPQDDRIGLAWGDSRLGNVIWQDYRPAVICDWEACALSPTEADVGWWLMFDRMSFDDVGAERMEGFPTREEMIRIYEEVSGREVRAADYWEIFATMRFCAIFIPLADRMVNAGLVPEAMNMSVANQVTDALARLLDIENPTPSRVLMAIEAVLFDFGGVFTRSPFDAVRAAAEELGLEGDLGLSLCFGPYDEDTDHAWHRLERGELTLAETRTELAALAAAAGHDLDPFTLLVGMGAVEDEQREPMIERARAVKARGVGTAVVTNNIKEFGEGWRKLVPVDELFDVVIDSSAVGVRKPDPRIFTLALDALGGVSPDAAVLVDDAPGNIVAARAAGLHAVLVGVDRLAAMDELDALLD